jgi:hypothetical protein
MDTVIIAIGTVIGGANSWPKVAKFGQCPRAWLKRFLSLPQGIPSHVAFGRVLGLLPPLGVPVLLGRLSRHPAHGLGERDFAIDDKTLQGSAPPPGSVGALHIVSAWDTAANLTLGQVAVDEKSQESTVIPQLLAPLERKGARATIDALGCQKEVAQPVVAREG